MKDDWCYFNGEIIRFNEIKISPYDLGFVRGYGIFDAMRTANGHPFCFDEHWDKLLSSSSCLNLKIPVTKIEFREIIQTLLEKNNFKEMAIKTILTGGESANGFTKSDNPTFLVIVDDLGSFLQPSEVYTKGCKVISCQYQRTFPEIKNLDYLKILSMQSLKSGEGALEVVYKSNGNFLECSTSNIFMVKNGVIITPKEKIFPGSTRNLVINLARKNNFSVEERNVSEAEFYQADEIFITATYKKIIPVVKVDNVLINEEKIGDTTRNMISLLDDFIANYSL